MKVKLSVYLTLLVTLWGCILFSFVLGSLVSNLIPLVVFLVSFSFYCNHNKAYIFFSVLFSLIFLVSFMLASLLRFGFYEDFILQGGYYFRGLLITLAVLVLAKYDKEIFFNTLILLSCLTSLLFAFSYLSEILGFGISIFNLVPDVYLSREYSGFTGMYNNPNYWAVFAFLHFSILFYGMHSKNTTLKNSFVFLCLFIAGVSLISTGSRMGILLAAIVIFWGVDFEKKLKIGGGVILLVLFLSLFLNDDFFSLNNTVAIDKSFNRFERLIYNIEEEDRFLRAQAYIGVFIISPDNFIFGGGMGRDLSVGPPHNTFLLLFRDFGIVGVTLMLLLLSSLMLISRKKNINNKKTYYSYLMALFIFFISNDIADSRPFWMILGLLLSHLLTEESDVEKSSFCTR